MSTASSFPHRDLALAGDAASLQSFERLWAHYQAELTNDVHGVMDTVVPDRNVLATPVFWAVNGDPKVLVGRGDRTKAMIFPGYRGAQANYSALYQDIKIRDVKIVLQICGGWWAFHQAKMETTNRAGQDGECGHGGQGDAFHRDLAEKVVCPFSDAPPNGSFPRPPARPR